MAVCAFVAVIGRRDMKSLIVLIPLLVAAPAIAEHHEDRVINSGSELRDWCKEESEATFIGKGLTPVQLECVVLGSRKCFDGQRPMAAPYYLTGIADSLLTCRSMMMLRDRVANRPYTA
jgi:hypothetical protein